MHKQSQARTHIFCWLWVHPLVWGEPHFRGEKSGLSSSPLITKSYICMGNNITLTLNYKEKGRRRWTREEEIHKRKTRKTQHQALSFSPVTMSLFGAVYSPIYGIYITSTETLQIRYNETSLLFRVFSLLLLFCEARLHKRISKLYYTPRQTSL